MISEPLEPARGMRGYVLRYEKVAVGFKLAIIVGYERSDKTFRVRLWSARKARWSKARTRCAQADLSPLTVEERAKHATMLTVAKAAEPELKAYW